jgi:hypothetical protein
MNYTFDLLYPGCKFILWNYRAEILRNKFSYTDSPCRLQDRLHENLVLPSAFPVWFRGALLV